MAPEWELVQEIWHLVYVEEERRCLIWWRSVDKVVVLRILASPLGINRASRT